MSIRFRILESAKPGDIVYFSYQIGYGTGLHDLRDTEFHCQLKVAESQQDPALLAPPQDSLENSVSVPEADFPSNSYTGLESRSSRELRAV